MDEAVAGFLTIIVGIFLLIFLATQVKTCSHNANGEQRSVTFIKKFTEPKLKVISDEPQVYVFDNDGDFFKITEGKKYKVWVHSLGSNPERIYDVGPEVK